MGLPESELARLLNNRIRSAGPIPFRDYMEAVLYHPEFGYYTSSQPRIGRDGDFYTSSDLDPIFGKLLARRFETMSRDFDGFTLVELGAGKGLLARDILSSCRFPYLILERSPAMRLRQQEALRGFDVEWIDDLPSNLTGCIFSNEFFDALPVHRFIGRSGGIREIFVGENFAEIECDPSVDIALAFKGEKTPPAFGHPPSKGGTFGLSQHEVLPSKGGTFGLSQHEVLPSKGGTFGLSQHEVLPSKGGTFELPQHKVLPSKGGTFGLSQHEVLPSKGGTFGLSQHEVLPSKGGTFGLSQHEVLPSKGGTFELPQHKVPPFEGGWPKAGGVFPPFTLGEGQVADVNLEAISWIRRIAESLARGFHLAIDYGYLRDEYYAQPRGTLMCYWRHQAHENPYIHIGEQDLTAHVNFSDLIDEGARLNLETVHFSDQKNFLIDLGILDEMQPLAFAGDSVSMQRLLRMKNLIIPDRMGERFKVLVQQKRI